MKANDLDRATRTLRFKAKYRRTIAVAISLWGVFMAFVGAGMLRSASNLIKELLGTFPEDPSASLLLAVIAMVAVASIVVGIVAVYFGVVRFFVPDPKTTVLLALVDRENQTQRNDKPDET